MFKELKRNTLYRGDTLKDQGITEESKNKGNGSSVSFITCKTTTLLLLFRLFLNLLPPFLQAIF